MKPSTPSVFHAIFALVLAAASAAAAPLDLSGSWRFALDAPDLGLKCQPDQWEFPDVIKLPGILTAQGFGDAPTFKTAWTGDGWRYPQMFKEWQADANFKFPFFLQAPRHYVGPAWYQRDIDIPEDWKGGGAVLHLERVHWHSICWIDGREVGKGDSLGTPHEFELGNLTPGRHVLTLRIDNRIGEVNVGPLSHSVTDHTQGNWNGVVGKIEVRKTLQSEIRNIQVFPSMNGRVRVVVSGVVAGNRGEGDVGAVLKRAGRPDAPNILDIFKSESFTADDDGNFKVELVNQMSSPPALWSEINPEMYELDVGLQMKSESLTLWKSIPFGFREVGTKDGRITLNGRKIFLRGTLECCIFPLTGHPPTDVDSWRRIVRICKAHGLNHIRFHSWCPPEAAFQAADELGFYYQVEVSAWAPEIGSGKPLDAWLEAESLRMLAAYGNHPSFLLMAYGNEPGGNNHRKWLQDWAARRKAADPRRLYTTAAGWPLMAGSDFHSSPDPRIQGWGQGLRSIINGQAPRTDFDWSGFVKKHSDAPVISHEIGQWCVYPKFDGIRKYTGYFKAHNFEIFEETARRNGLIDQAGDFVKASGKLQALAYKHDIEAALRTPGFGGFQLLDLHDFPGQGTALVGVLDAFWDEKGYISPAEFSTFCGPVVPLARLKKMVYTTAESLVADIELAHFGPQDFKALGLAWSLAAADGTVITRGALPERDLAAGDLYQIGGIRVPLDKVTAPAKLQLTVAAAGGQFANVWDVFVYPAAAVPATPAGVVVTRDMGEAKAALAQGGRVLWLPPAAQVRNDPARPLVAGFSPIFWNTAWTNWQPPHTLGILCDPKHPALAAFPTDFHSNWQWWEIQQNAQPFILTDLREAKPIVQVIDDWFTNRKLGYVFEAQVGKGKLLACSANLSTNLDQRPAARQLLVSLLEYLGSKSFAPGATLTTEAMDGLVKP
jgi:hypothetical protein